jgi:metal-responsive CopG/Arc/MetJ family transcriptional regulator
MRIIINLPEKALKELEKAAKAQNRSRKNLIETIILNYIQNLKL